MTLFAILSAFVLVIAWAWFVHEVQTRRDVRKPKWQVEMERQAAAFREIERALGMALLPAVRRATEAMREFNAAYAKIAEECS